MDEAPFIPDLYVLTEYRRPSFITGAAVMGVRQKRVALPEGIDGLPLSERYRGVGEIIRRHYATSHGECPLFGRITGYAYRLTTDTATMFTVEGQVQAECIAFREAGVAVARIGRHSIRFE